MVYSTYTYIVYRKRQNVQVSSRNVQTKLEMVQVECGNVQRPVKNVQTAILWSNPQIRVGECGLQKKAKCAKLLEKRANEAGNRASESRKRAMHPKKCANYNHLVEPSN